MIHLMCCILTKIPHILEDTRDFLSHLNQLCHVSDNTLLVIFDVVGFYPHTPHEECLETMNRYLDKRYQLVSSDSLYTVGRIILKHNYFDLGQDVYPQILGTAIHAKFAPHYAKRFMAGLEEQIFRNTEL